MRDSYMNAKLFENNVIKIMMFSNIEKEVTSKFILIENSVNFFELKINKSTFLNGIMIYECIPNFKIELGNTYYISLRDFGTVPLDVSNAIDFKNFDTDYYYSGNDLGATYYNDHTEFKIWAPLASDVVLLLRKNNTFNFQSFVMKRGDYGVYELSLDGDYDGYFYRYKITNNGLTFVTTDPYAKGSSSNGKDSAVINFKKINIDLHNEMLPILKNNYNAIIYETSVRDFTIDPSTTIKNKGKFLGLVEENAKTKKGNPAGFDYLKFLGITHLQLLPIFDFKTVDEDKGFKDYNWGYDPQQYFVPEGSYSLNPNDPYSRIIELKQMVSKLHEAGIKVNMDVVFNHVYDYNNNVFEKVVPNYYFRKTRNGRISNDSFCGDDLDTKRPMVRKMICDSLAFFMNEYGIDGFRFDLLGLMDIECAKAAYKVIKSIKKDAMIYGEGWDMANSLKSEERTTFLNASKVKDIGFFNDSYREIIRGSVDGSKIGYLSGNTNYLEGFKFVFMGSVVDYCFNKKMDNVNQSINYVECHDNSTLYDVLIKNFKDENTILRIIKLVNATILLSYGVSFIHAGQEIGLTKYGEDNTHNMGDKYNMFNYNVLDSRFCMAQYLKSIIEFKKSLSSSLLLTSEEISENTYFINLSNGGVIIKLKKLGPTLNDCIIIINPTNKKINVELDDYYMALVVNAGMVPNSNLYVKTVFMNPYELNVFIKKGV